MAVAIDAEGIRALFPEVDRIEDAALRQGVIDIWLDIAAQCDWDDFAEIPKNLGSEAGRGLLGHIQGVTKMAISLAEIAQAQHGTPCDMDMLIAACLLHDVSKVVECEPDPDAAPTNGPVKPARKSEIGAKIQHGVYAAHKVFEKNLPTHLAHLVVTHTHASNVRTPTFEGACLFYADYADSDAGIIPTGGTSFAQRWEIS